MSKARRRQKTHILPDLGYCAFRSDIAQDIKNAVPNASAQACLHLWTSPFVLKFLFAARGEVFAPTPAHKRTPRLPLLGTANKKKESCQTFHQCQRRTQVAGQSFGSSILLLLGLTGLCLQLRMHSPPCRLSCRLPACLPPLPPNCSLKNRTDAFALGPNSPLLSGLIPAHARDCIGDGRHTPS